MSLGEVIPKLLKFGGTAFQVKSYAADGATLELDLKENDLIKISVSANVTLTMVNKNATVIMLIFSNDASARTITFPAGYWPAEGSTTKTYSLPASSDLLVTMIYDGTNIYYSALEY